MGRWLAPVFLVSVASLSSYIWRLYQEGHWFLIAHLVISYSSFWLVGRYAPDLSQYEYLACPLLALSRPPTSSSCFGFPMALLHVAGGRTLGLWLGKYRCAWVVDLLPVVALAASALGLFEGAREVWRSSHLWLAAASASV
jgi:hypothetical protein